ncbi:MAG: septum formation protein Maf [Bacteroidetes bacterium]|nr:septum formation protein Maf [Bacteroidota bacterium]MBU1373213.1 septum formation protein Maf [Bacteroidota bacterium]MBU1486285.1 septum formation protein Maf [Bacteroidota bacterium]MBU1760568.1 septum formation protein Maf [Bacteroidota bacterium]MBU2045134.1 septum formation protein Maf [Bacteroidota bacterium]
MSKKIYLASKSPRRQELLKQMGFEYELLIKEVDESYPADLPLNDVAEYIAKKKSDAFETKSDGVIITSDTVVLLGTEILGKPINDQHAFEMLRKLNGKTHHVITGVTLKSAHKSFSFSEVTAVTFSQLSDEQLWYYILEFKPFDKAGSYGIQDWIGAVGVQSINGSYTNVMGLPTERLFKELANFD